MMGFYDFMYLVRNNQKKISDFELEYLQSVSFTHWKLLLLVRPDLINEVRDFLTTSQIVEILSVNKFCINYYQE